MSLVKGSVFFTFFIIHISPSKTYLDENQISSSGSRIGSKSYGDDIGSGTGQYSTEPWLLHDLSSPIFMRFFDIPSTWIEAESICRKHFGHLVRDGNGNEAAVHDFLSSLDVHSEVWIGLHQATPLDRFHWIDDIPPPPRSFEAIGSSPTNLWGEFTEDHEMGMCISVDPESGYRWNTRYCNGPDEATFVCQIPVPKWIFEGRCNMGILMQTASEVATEVDVNRVEYFPHNDTLHTIYRCGQDSKDSTTRIRTCTFSNNVNRNHHCAQKKSNDAKAEATTASMRPQSSCNPVSNSAASRSKGSSNDWGCDFQTTTKTKPIEVEMSKKRQGDTTLASSKAASTPPHDGSFSTAVMSENAQIAQKINPSSSAIPVEINDVEILRAKRDVESSSAKSDDGRFLAIDPGPWTSVGLKFPNNRRQPSKWRTKITSAASKPIASNSTSNLDRQLCSWGLKILQKGQTFLEDLSLLRPRSVTTTTPTNSPTSRATIS